MDDVLMGGCFVL